MMTSASYRVSPELEAVWQKHAAHIAWTTSPTSVKEFSPTIASVEGTIHALSPPPRARARRETHPQKASASKVIHRLDQIQEEPMMRHVSVSDDQIHDTAATNKKCEQADPLAHIRERARRRKRATLQARSKSTSDLRHNNQEILMGPPLRVEPGSAPPVTISHSRAGSETSMVTMDASVSYLNGSEESQRISISSTVYEPSMGHTSYIDFLSPQTPFFPSPSSVSDDERSRSRSRSPKPPLPTTPKPHFNRSSPNLTVRRSDLPPTTNYLQPDTRADLVRKSRKLAQVFGQTVPSHSFLDMPPTSMTRHLKGVMSVSVPQDYSPQPSPSLERRHSASDDFYIEVGSQEAHSDFERSPPTSFIDLTDEQDEEQEQEQAESPTWRTPQSPSMLSLFESLSPDEQQDELRRRKRDKLAKLHRFLGSRVPANLVLGLADPVLSLPPMPPSPPMEPTDDKKWLRRRRSSSVAAFPLWSDDHDRVKDDLDDKEKAINVRRAHKMEKVFGVAPPQTLYHTRYGASSLLDPLPRSEPLLVSGKFLRVSTDSSLQPPSPKSANKLRSKKAHRPSTADSSRHLLSKGSVVEDSGSIVPRSQSGSPMYSHYQHSLNSLVDIIDRDDRASLAELHEYLHMDSTPPTPVDRRLSIRSERRRSLPARTSMNSLTSEYSLGESIASPKADVSDFQLRRRRAAKLTAFFGVDYRELVQDVIESIETGLEHEQKRGTINPEEASDLLKRLREIKTKRDRIY